MIFTNSFDVREFCRERLEDKIDGFNATFVEAAARYGLGAVTLRTTGNPPTLFLGRYDLVTIQRAVGVNPGLYAVLSVGSMMGGPRNNMRVTPSMFCGGIPIALDFYVINPNGSMPPDGEAFWFALEEAILATFNSDGGSRAVPSGISYNNEIQGDPGRMEWDGTRFYQVINFTIYFNKITNGF